jgi:hypothetical protein
VWRRGSFARAEEVYFYRGGTGQWVDLLSGRREDLGDFRWRVQGEAIVFETARGLVVVAARRVQVGGGRCALHLARNPFLLRDATPLVLEGVPVDGDDQGDGRAW